MPHPKSLQLRPRNQNRRGLRCSSSLAWSQSALYMLLLAGVTVVSVLAQHTGFIYLVFAVFFIAGALGLLLLQRWAWALTLAAVAILSGSFLWGFSTQHSGSSLVQGILNLFFFLYLVRTEVRQQLK